MCIVIGVFIYTSVYLYVIFIYMSDKAQHECRHPMCHALTQSTFCPAHAGQSDIELLRGSAAQRGYNARWRKARLIWLGSHQMCAVCLSRGIRRIATIVDHIVPHRGNTDIFWDQSNWQSLCRECHDTKTMQEVNSRRRRAVVPEINKFIRGRG